MDAPRELLFVPRFIMALYMAGEMTSPPRMEQMRMGPNMPRLSMALWLFNLGWSTFR